MTLYFITDSRFGKSPESIYNLNGSLGDVLWARYLEHFDKVVVVARVLQNAPINSEAPQTSDPRISFIEIPYFIGPFEYIRLASEIKKIIGLCIQEKAAYICRVPSTLGDIAIRELRRRKIKYAVEVVGDPRASLSYRATHKIIPAILSYFSANKLKRNVYGAAAALYVTNEVLQKKYPVRAGVFSIGVSDVVIDTNVMYCDVKPFPKSGTIELLSVGSLEQMYKAPDIVLKALRVAKDNGIAFHFTWLGDGKYKNDMIELSRELGISDSVSFMGSVSKVEVSDYLRSSDIYIQASRTEGLPRALVEAMAVGLPCVGSKVGGIPELITRNYLIEVDDVKKLAEIILRLASDISFANVAKEENFNKALEFSPVALTIKRDSYFLAVKCLYNQGDEESNYCS